MIYAVESIAKCWDEWKAFAATHWEGEFDPDEARYKRNSEQGWFILCTGRSNSELVAYCGLYILPSMHNKKMIASEDFVYIAPEHRRGRNAAIFYDFCERAVRFKGANEVYLKVTPDSPAERYIKAMDYKISKVQYSKKLT